MHSYTIILTDAAVKSLKSTCLATNHSLSIPLVHLYQHQHLKIVAYIHPGRRHLSCGTHPDRHGVRDMHLLLLRYLQAHEH